MQPNLQSPLIPLPKSPAKRSQDKLPSDSYSSLFDSSDASGSIFKASPTPTPAASEPRPTTVPLDTSIDDLDSEFGSFIAVSPTHDPLSPDNFSSAPNTQAAADASSYGSFTAVDHPPAGSQTPNQFNDYFFESAKHRSKENEQRVLRELLDHEDDPMYWLTGSAVSSLKDQSKVAALEEASSSPSIEQLLIDVDLDADHFSPPPTKRMSPVAKLEHLSGKSSRRSSSPPVNILRRKTSLPTLSSSPPAEPIHDPMSASMTHGSPSRSAKQLLGTISSSSLPLASSPARPSYLTSTATLSKSFFNTLTGGKTLTHQTPFARDLFVPPSGAPGFDGDHTWNRKGFEFNETTEKSQKSVRLMGRKVSSEVLTVDLANQIRSSLPPLARLTSTWTLLYSLDQHGISLQTFYQECSKHEGGCVLVIQDSEGGTFGSWISEPLKEHAGSFYGTGDAFLWKQLSNERRPVVQVFKWTGMNDYVALCEPDSVSFGGGDGHYGLYLSASLIDGSSATCPTFNNEVLCSGVNKKGASVEFESVGVEVWGVKMGG